MQIRQAFDYAYQQLTAPSYPHDSVLQRIIRLDSVLTERPKPDDPLVPEQLEQHARHGYKDKHSHSTRSHRSSYSTDEAPERYQLAKDDMEISEDDRPHKQHHKHRHHHKSDHKSSKRHKKRVRERSAEFS